MFESRTRLRDTVLPRTRSTSHSVAAHRGCTNIPLAAVGAQEDETILEDGLFRPCKGAVRPPGSARTDQVLEDLRFGQRLSSGAFHHDSLDNDTGGHIFPECYQQLSRQCHDCPLLKTAAIALDPFFKPLGQRRLRLMAQP